MCVVLTQRRHSKTYIPGFAPARSIGVAPPSASGSQEAKPLPMPVACPPTAAAPRAGSGSPARRRLGAARRWWHWHPGGGVAGPCKPGGAMFVDAYVRPFSRTTHTHYSHEAHELPRLRTSHTYPPANGRNGPVECRVRQQPHWTGWRGVDDPPTNKPGNDDGRTEDWIRPWHQIQIERPSRKRLSEHRCRLLLLPSCGLTCHCQLPLPITQMHLTRHAHNPSPLAPN